MTTAVVTSNPPLIIFFTRPTGPNPDPENLVNTFETLFLNIRLRVNLPSTFVLPNLLFCSSLQAKPFFYLLIANLQSTLASSE
jgi:hypothetical protein